MHGAVRRMRAGSLQPLIVALLLLLWLLGLGLLALYRDTVLQQQALAAAEAVASQALRSLQPPEYALPDPTPEERSLDLGQLNQLAQANGLGPAAFEPITADDMDVGPTWVRVTPKSKNPRAKSVAVIANGVPAGRIEAGHAWLDEGGEPVGTTGCLPLGVQIAALPDTDGAGTSFWLQMATSKPQAVCLRLSAVSNAPEQQVRYLGFKPAEPLEGLPPPAIEMGDVVSAQPPSAGFLAELRRRLRGRVVVVPLLSGDAVVGFGRLRLEDANLERMAVRFALAPSAVVRAAAASARGEPASDRQPGHVSPYGLALRTELRRQS